jgi:uncharacterized protein YacL
MSGTRPLLLIVLFLAVALNLVSSLATPEIGGSVGLAIGLIWLAIGFSFEKKEEGFAGIIGAMVGVFVAGLSSLMLNAVLGNATIWIVFSLVVFPNVGFSIAREMRPFRVAGLSQRDAEATPSGTRRAKVIDTSTIIDGRIANVAQTGFLEGPFIIPQFILRELQHIADSSDSLKRVRGRRGLDVLQRLQKMPELDVRIVEDDFPDIREVDDKLVALGKKFSAKVITNDFNLNKVAELQGVPVLNINLLSNAVKPAVLPGESMNIYVVKDGKEIGQGVGYMDDGTMIVVDDGRKSIGRNVDVIVTSILQTPAGRMIFTRLREGAAVYPMAKEG